MSTGYVLFASARERRGHHRRVSTAVEKAEPPKWNRNTLARRSAEIGRLRGRREGKRPNVARQSVLDMSLGLPCSRQQFVETVDGMTADHPPQHIMQVGIGFHVIELTGLNQRTENGPTMAAAIAPREQMVLAAESDGPDRPLDGIGVELDAPMVQEARQSCPTRESIADCFGKRAATWDKRELPLEPRAQGLNDRRGEGAALGKPVGRRPPAHARLNGIEFADPAKRLGRHGRVRRLGNIIELAPRVGPTRSENDIVSVGELLEAGIAIDII